MIQQILLAITFVYGPIHLLTTSKLFNGYLYLFTKSLSLKDRKITNFINRVIFYFSLCYQSYYWLFKALH